MRTPYFIAEEIEIKVIILGNLNGLNSLINFQMSSYSNRIELLSMDIDGAGRWV